MTRLWTDYLNEVENPVKVTFKNGTAIKIEKDTIPNVYGDFYYSNSGYTKKLADELWHQFAIGRNDEMMSTHCPDEYSRFTRFYHYADEYSKFTQVRESQYAYNSDYGLSIPISCSVHYYIDDNEVDEQTFNEVMIKVQNDYEVRTNKRCGFQVIEDGDSYTTWNLNIGDNNMNWLDYMKEVDYPERGRRIEHSYTDEWYKTIGKLYDYNKKCEVNDMNKNITITNYKYDEKTGRTTLWWSDNTQTTVTADPDTESSQYVGFVSACAKKLFGNKSTYLNQFDKWTVKIPARKKAEAEKKAAEDKVREEARAKRAAKKEERRRQRLIDDIAKSIVDDYNTADIIEAAEKRAIEKYGVPSDYIANRNNCECDCCKEQE